MRLLFVKRGLAWPHSSGHDVHTFHMMRACAELGQEVALATVAPTAPEALAGLALRFHRVLTTQNGSSRDVSAIRFSRLQERYRSYWGVERAVVAELHGCVREFEPDAVIVVGLEALTYLPAVPGNVIRVWYAADEWIWHHLSLIRAAEPATWREHLGAAAVKGLYERAYAPLIDRAWVVSPSERRAMRGFAGVSHVDVLPNGVDAEYYKPLDVAEVRDSAVFWGRLDFEPNVQGLKWFCRHVWPTLRGRVPNARFTIIGFNPGEAVRSLATLPGIELKADLQDLRPEVSRHSAVVLPFISGGGIKNKLLEAAALARPIVCTSKAANGLREPWEAGLVVADTPTQWIQQLQVLWSNEDLRRRCGAAGRAWVVARHSWSTAARDAIRALQASVKQEGAA